MAGLHGYHCNSCGAWLLRGDVHSCDPARLDIIDRIADFLGQRHIHNDSENIVEALTDRLAITGRVETMGNGDQTAESAEKLRLLPERKDDHN